MAQTREICRYQRLRLLPFILAKYTVINYISSKHIIPIDIDSLSDSFSNASSPLDDVVAKDTQLLIDMVVENMPQQRQMIYRMSREQHLKNDEIAQRLGIAEENGRESSKFGS